MGSFTTVWRPLPETFRTAQIECVFVCLSWFSRRHISERAVLHAYEANRILEYGVRTTALSAFISPSFIALFRRPRKKGNHIRSLTAFERRLDRKNGELPHGRTERSPGSIR